MVQIKHDRILAQTNYCNQVPTLKKSSNSQDCGTLLKASLVCMRQESLLSMPCKISCFTSGWQNLTQDCSWAADARCSISKTPGCWPRVQKTAASSAPTSILDASHPGRCMLCWRIAKLRKKAVRLSRCTSRSGNSIIPKVSAEAGTDTCRLIVLPGIVICSSKGHDSLQALKHSPMSGSSFLKPVKLHTRHMLLSSPSIQDNKIMN